MVAAGLLSLQLAAAALPPPPPPVMPHLLFPSPKTYPPTYNLSRATAIQTCQQPGTSLDYIRDYGIVSYDWSNNAATCECPAAWLALCQLRALRCALP